MIYANARIWSNLINRGNSVVLLS